MKYLLIFAALALNVKANTAGCCNTLSFTAPEVFGQNLNGEYHFMTMNGERPVYGKLDQTHCLWWGNNHWMVDMCNHPNRDDPDLVGYLHMHADQQEICPDDAGPKWRTYLTAMSSTVVGDDIELHCGDGEKNESLVFYIVCCLTCTKALFACNILFIEKIFQQPPCNFYHTFFILQ